jgi:aspartyl/asparaginyl beta-hydroxylase (cupin superfamily)
MTLFNKFNVVLVLLVLSTVLMVWTWRRVGDNRESRRAPPPPPKLATEFRSEFNTHAANSVYWADLVRHVPIACMRLANASVDETLDARQPRLSLLPGFFNYVGFASRPRVLAVESTKCKAFGIGNGATYEDLDRVRFEALQNCTAMAQSAHGVAHPHCVVAVLESAWQDDMQRPAIAYPGLFSQMVWHDGPMQFAEAQALEANFADIDAEFDKLVELGLLRIHPEQLVEREGDWRVFTLWSGGQEHTDNTRLAPKTAALWRSMNERLPRTRRMVFGLVYFSVLVPGANVLPHFGSTNMRIRHHIGIRVPSEGTVIKLVNLPLAWRRGRVISFDDSFVHSVINNATTARAVLIADIWHPELREEELLAMQEHFRIPTRVPKQVVGDQSNPLNYAAKD